jgi:Zn-dependent protease
MTRSLTVARVGEVDVRLHPTFALVFLWVLIDWRRVGTEQGVLTILFTLVLVLLIFACVLLHEFGHVLMARQYGVRVHDISLSAVGGVARMEQLPVDPRVEIAIALAGPAANFALVSALLPITILLGVASGFSSPADYALSVFQPSLAGLATTLLYANLLIIVSNLVPAFPMDGGRVLRASLSTMWGREAATRMAMVLGELLAVLLLIFAIFVLQSVIVALLALFVMVVAYAEDRAVRVESALRRMRVGQFALWDMGGISPEQPLAYALRGGPRDLAVTKGGRVVGMLWRNQVLAELSRAPSTKTVGEVMEPNVAVVDADTTVFDVQLMMIEQDRWAVPVTESALYRGLFTGDRVLHIYRQLSPDPLSMIKAFLNRGPLAGLRT